MFKKKVNEEQLREHIAEQIREVGYDIMSDAKSWSPQKLAIIRDCFDISAKVASGWESKRINL